MKSLIETARMLQLDEKVSPRTKIAIMNLLDNIIRNVESMNDEGGDTRTNIQTVLKDYGGIEKLEDLLEREIDSR